MINPPDRHAGCPSDLDLELFLQGDPAANAHVQECRSCAERLTWMRGAEAEFVSRVMPATTALVWSRLQGHSCWERLAAPLGALAAMLVAVLLSTPGPLPGHIGTKGPPQVQLRVYLGEGVVGRRLLDGDRVHPGDALRFSVAGRGARMFLMTIDSAGTVSRLYPTSMAEAAPPPGLLESGAILDDVLGPERIFAVFPRYSGVTYEVLEQVALRALPLPTPESVRGLTHLPIDADQATLLLEKVPR